jgi:YgiT-type zinc finger domain-containing protein
MPALISPSLLTVGQEEIKFLCQRRNEVHDHRRWRPQGASLCGAVPVCRGRDGTPSMEAQVTTSATDDLRRRHPKTSRGQAARDHRKETAMSETSATRCTACHKGKLTPTPLTVTLTYDGHSFPVDDDEALVCEACGNELIGEGATAFLLTQRALAPDAEMIATVTRRGEAV